MRFITNDELLSQEKAEKESESSAIREAEEGAQNDFKIAAYLQTCWTKARDAKERSIETQILNNMTQIEGEYDTTKLKAIKEIGGSEVYMMITDAKCKNAFYWVEDILFQPGKSPFGVEPTPIPELPKEIQATLYSSLMMEVLTQLAQEAQASGQQVTPDMANKAIQEIMPIVEERARALIIAKSKLISKQTELKLDDKLTEGGWYKALKAAIPNVIMHTGFIVGPTMQIRRTTKTITDPNTGKLVVITEKKPVPVYESRHPLFIYPAPNSTGINDGYIFDRIKLTPIALQDCLGIPGYNDEEIRAVLKEAQNGKLSEWLQVDQSVRDLYDQDSMWAYDSDKIDCLRFWGYVSGKMLNEWGLPPEQGDEPIEEELYYNIVAHMIGNHVINISRNRDPLGRKNIYKASFEDRDGAFWGRGLPEIIKDVQTICNACARAIVNNVGIASGPQVERNIDRIPAASRNDNFMRPWKVWDVTESTMLSPAPALKFYQPPMVVDKLMNVYKEFSKIADEHSGVPAFAHGDPNVGGAGNTASGLSMLMGSAARGIKGLVRNIDENLIAPSVSIQYEWLVNNEDMRGFVCDNEIVTLGSTSALVKEQLAARRLEFLQLTANPVDAQILGLEGRKYLLEETAESMSLDLTRIFKNAPPPPQMPGGPGAPGAPPPQQSQELDQAGNPVSGTDTRTAGQGPPGEAGYPPPLQPGGPQPAQKQPMMMVQSRAGGGPVDPNQPYLVGEQGPEVIVPQQSGEVIPAGPPRFAPEQTEAIPTDYGNRIDGTPKGHGFLGDLRMQDNTGRIATEFSVTVDLNGQPTLVPTLIPSLNPQEISHILNGGSPTPVIIKKAAAFAKDRIRRGLSPFLEEGREAPTIPGTQRGNSPFIGPGQIESRAEGGEINALQPYLVGEQGPELAIPDATGTVEKATYPVDVDNRTSKNVFLDIRDGDFRHHRGNFPEQGIERALQEYDRYVTEYGRKVPLDLWLGTALQESGFGKYAFRRGKWGAAPDWRTNPVQNKYSNYEHPNIMYGEADDEYRNDRLFENPMFTEGWQSVLKDPKKMEEINTNANNRLANELDIVKKYKEKNIEVNPAWKDLGEAIRDQLEVVKYRYAEEQAEKQGFNVNTDFAAHKLQEGLDKFGTPERASRWYNQYDTVPREKIPALGREIMKNKRVMELIKSRKKS